MLRYTTLWNISIQKSHRPKAGSAEQARMNCGKWVVLAKKNNHKLIAQCTRYRADRSVRFVWSVWKEAVLKNWLKQTAIQDSATQNIRWKTSGTDVSFIFYWWKEKKGIQCIVTPKKITEWSTARIYCNKDRYSEQNAFFAHEWLSVSCWCRRYQPECWNWVTWISYSLIPESTSVEP